MLKAKILLVESRLAGSNSLAAALQKARYQLNVVHTGTAAVTSLQQELPDLIIFDASAMRTAGTRSCRQIRRAAGQIPIIHARAVDTPEDPQAEADFYLMHPFTARKMINRIRALLPADDAKEEIIRFGNLVYYRSKRSVDMDHHGEKRLTPKLARLLEEFMRHPNEIITRRHLMENVWNTTYVGDTRTLDVHVRWIREFIEENPAAPELLRTVRGQGYIFSLLKI